MATADEFKILDKNNRAVPPTGPMATYLAAVRAIVCLQELRRAHNSGSMDRIAEVEQEADHIIKSAGLSL